MENCHWGQLGWARVKNWVIKKKAGEIDAQRCLPSLTSTANKVLGSAKGW